MATAQPIVLPGDKIPSSALPTSANPNKPLTLGPGLRHIPPNTITTTIAGALATDTRKNATWVEYNSGRVCLPNISTWPFLSSRYIFPVFSFS